MKLRDPQSFILDLIANSSYRLSNDAGDCKFSPPATIRGVAKLYTVSAAGVLIYVGVATQPMSSRLNIGFKANGKGGHYGYKWKELTQRLDLAGWFLRSCGHPELTIQECGYGQARTENTVTSSAPGDAVSYQWLRF